MARRKNHDPDNLGNNAPIDRYIPQNPEFLSIQNTSIPADFEDQLREIDTTIGDMASKESQAVEDFSDCLAIQLDDVVAKSGGLGVTPSSGLTKSGPPSEGTWKRLEKSQIFKEVVMGDQNEISKRKLEALEDTREDALELAKRSKLKDAVSLGKGLFVPSDGKSGGLALLWKPDVKVDIQMVSRWHIEAFIDSGVEMVQSGHESGEFIVSKQILASPSMMTWFQPSFLESCNAPEDSCSFIMRGGAVGAGFNPDFDDFSMRFSG
ncbi:hypothetical protein CMV_030499 [Castanea mollissima]|uniref:Uncharacterized protein n=1 Tax=Castanea mollissima TaxID=60419 RepID=A0A8J4Q3B6_9ROSI|nr:hypothetical protein CMV_030499 [Castanea mollissima]